MKYLLIILAVVVCSSVVTLYNLWPSDPLSSQDVALRVNGHQFTYDNIEDQRVRKGYHTTSREGDIDSLVTKQLLIQEAQRLGIDRNNDFRKALKDYYEQSLIKVLTDRKLASIEAGVTEEDIDRYLASSGKIFIFTRIQMEKGIAEEHQSQQHSVLFDDLSESLRLILTTLQPGEQVGQFETGTELSLIRLDKVALAKGVTPVAYDRKKVREQLENYQRSLEIGRWIDGLRKKASIVVHDEAKKND
jgi:hypothetical protein